MDAHLIPVSPENRTTEREPLKMSRIANSGLALALFVLVAGSAQAQVIYTVPATTTYVTESIPTSTVIMPTTTTYSVAPTTTTYSVAPTTTTYSVAPTTTIYSAVPTTTYRYAPTTYRVVPTTSYRSMDTVVIPTSATTSVVPTSTTTTVIPTTTTTIVPTSVYVPSNVQTIYTRGLFGRYRPTSTIVY
jgi:hypothetical protein